MLPTGILNHTSVFKKIIFAFAISSFYPVYAQIEPSAPIESGATYFIVTGYYSPIQWQEDYITWTFEWDKRLNGNGTNSASGNEVLTWVLAAPSTYPFWTKILFEGYGIWVVEDRGWAIVAAWVRGHEYDRIDVWMGIGDAWRIRAINWWVRKLKGKIVSIEEEPTLQLTEGISHSLFNTIRVSPESTEDEIIALQTFLKSIGKYDGWITGKYSDVENSLINFQIELDIVKDREDWGAGHFWPKTIEAIKMKYGYGIGLKQIEATLWASEKAKLDKILQKVQQKLKKIPTEKQRKKATEELIEDIDLLIKKSINTKLHLKLQYIKENL